MSKQPSLFPEPDKVLLHIAKVHLAEAAKRRHSHVNRSFYWVLLAWAANARREYASHLWEVM
jgi:hypothetical protein